MKFCSECTKTLWPYAFIALIGGFVALLTWLALDSAGAGESANRALTGGAFAVTCVTLIGYMVWCVRRHCRQCRHEKMA